MSTKITLVIFTAGLLAVSGVAYLNSLFYEKGRLRGYDRGYHQCLVEQDGPRPKIARVGPPSPEKKL